ncbi:unnamed protein product (macronuclear) [Paramecium tetraurelia]|uniref:AP180 N-terminal homology (ANTH) domain-containing protein n=1 Tax=Paramecium tetraurelia TaxID=5888 RepID=A0DC61_PARTE|nr:uncharacterized protein GSPATT00015505001 [Paramecium tetraurelia]CAK80628.1 unnamed protein product [Paramecium tetraurelia]|eukprot:XP_001448025.1 hypothetical protein (macronuclear) [Paramecium tetraurelia strain d4-2]
MSSALSLAGQRWKEFWGTSKTSNIQLEDKKNRQSYLRNCILTLMYNNIKLTKEMQLLYGLLSQVLKKLDELEKSQEGILLAKTFDSLSLLHSSKIESIHKANDSFQEWFDTIEQLRQMLDKYQENRLVYDHYRLKVDELKNSKDQQRFQRVIFIKYSQNEKKDQQSDNSENGSDFEQQTKYVQQSVLNSYIQNETEIYYQAYKKFIKHEDFKAKFGCDNQKQQIDINDTKQKEQNDLSHQECKSDENISIKDIPAQGQDWNPFEQNNKSPYEDQLAQSQIVQSYFSQGAQEPVNPFEQGDVASFPSIYMPDQKFQSNYKMDYEKFKQSTKQPLE